MSWGPEVLEPVAEFIRQGATFLDLLASRMQGTKLVLHRCTFILFFKIQLNIRIINSPINRKFLYEYNLKDHLGNNRVTFMGTDLGGAVDIVQTTSYYPFGLVMNQYNGNTAPGYQKNKYLYNGKELQDDVFAGSSLNWFDYGARFYDPQIGRWHVADPFVEERLWVTPYNYVQNNPISRIDPDGTLDWEPDKEGNLIAEAGDNAQTLAKYQGITYSEALKQLIDQGYTVDNKGILNLKIGDKVELNNVFTESIKNSTSDFNTDAFLKYNETKVITGTGPTPEDYYNCWGSAIAGSQGRKIEVGVGINEGSTFDNILTNSYSSIDASNSTFEKTVLRFANSEGVQHGAVYYGSNKAGEAFVYTKNGWRIKPEVMKLSDLQLKIPSNGNVQGIKLTHSGYYSPK